jgi:hypothetical protein
MKGVPKSWWANRKRALPPVADIGLRRLAAVLLVLAEDWAMAETHALANFNSAILAATPAKSYSRLQCLEMQWRFWRAAEQSNPASRQLI